MMHTTQGKAPSLWLSRGARDAFTEMKERVELSVGRRLTQEQFVRLLVDNADWITERLREAYDRSALIVEGIMGEVQGAER